MIVLLICLYLIKSWFSHKRIHQLEIKLMSVLKDDYIAFAKSQSHLPKIDILNALRQQFPELSLTQAVKIYNWAGLDSSNK